METFRNNIVIIGAGIGGLVTALSLQKSGIKTKIFESEQDGKGEISGAGIILSINAMKVLTQLGIKDKVISQGRIINEVGLATPKGKMMTINNLGKTLDKLHVPSVAIHRKRLHKILTNELQNVTIEYSKKLKSLDTKNNICHFEDGQHASYSLLIGCDGINSVIRSEININQPIRDAKQICYRGTLSIENSNYEKARFVETWGNAKRFGFVNIGDDEIYWYATLRKDKYKEIASNEVQSILIEEFSSWWGPIASIIDSQEESVILRNDLYDRKPSSTWSIDNVVLLGDAIHATTPNMGQGAAMAIESGALLADCLIDIDDLSIALNTYQAHRADRTRKVTAMSWQIGLIANIKGELICRIRNALFRSIPNWILNLSANKFFFAKTGIKE